MTLLFNRRKTDLLLGENVFAAIGFGLAFQRLHECLRLLAARHAAAATKIWEFQEGDIFFKR